MPLNNSGPISIGGSTTGQSINLELGRSATAQSSLNETALRNLAGVSSGAISLSNFYGKSNVTFTPDGGTSSGSPYVIAISDTGYCEVTISCNQTAVWNWVKSGSSAGIANVANGGSATSITFSISAGSVSRSASFSVNGVANGVTRYYTVNITAEAEF